MIIALDILGAVTERIYLAGFPQYNDKTRKYILIIGLRFDTKIN
jgi:hypothetical protein